MIGFRGPVLSHRCMDTYSAMNNLHFSLDWMYSDAVNVVNVVNVVNQLQFPLQPIYENDPLSLDNVRMFKMES